MVFTGERSGACITCLARKVKCDQAKPECLRCRKGRRPCRGYREPLGIRFQDMTETTASKFTTDAGYSYAPTLAEADAELRRWRERERATASGSASSPDPDGPIDLSKAMVETTVLVDGAGRSRAALLQAGMGRRGGWRRYKGHMPDPRYQLEDDAEAHLRALLEHATDEAADSGEDELQRLHHDGFGGVGSEEWFLHTPQYLYAYGRSRNRTVPRNPSTLNDLEHRAICYFLARYADVPGPRNDGGYFSFLDPFLQQRRRREIAQQQFIADVDDRRSSGCFSTALQAAALAALAASPNSRSLRPKAQRAYAVALRAVRDALTTETTGGRGDDEMRRRGAGAGMAAHDDDELLAATLLLAFVEQVETGNLNGYYNHLKGATTIVQARKAARKSREAAAATERAGMQSATGWPGTLLGERHQPDDVPASAVDPDSIPGRLEAAVAFSMKMIKLVSYAEPFARDTGLWLGWLTRVKAAMVTMEQQRQQQRQQQLSGGVAPSQSLVSLSSPSSPSSSNVLSPGSSPGSSSGARSDSSRTTSFGAAGSPPQSDSSVKSPPLSPGIKSEPSSPRPARKSYAPAIPQVIDTNLPIRSWPQGSAERSADSWDSRRPTMSANSDTSAAPHGQTSPATASSPTTMPANANLQIRDLDSMIVMALVRIYASLPDQQAARTALLHGTQAEQNRALLGPLCMVLQQFERFEQASAAAAAADSPDGPITYIASSPPLASSTNNPYAAIFPPSSVPLLLYDGAPAAVRRLGFATARLTLCHIVARLAASAYPGGPREYRQSAEYRLAAATARDSIDIVMGTLPYLCGWDPSVADLGRLNLGRGCESEDGLVPSLLVFTLWPVFSCAASEFALPQQRAYLAGFLRFLANYAGISLAAALVDFCAAIDNGSVSDDLLQRIRSTLTSSI